MIALKASAVLAAALLSVALMRRRSAAARHWLLFAAIVCAALMPALEPVAPGWGLSLIGAASIIPGRARADADVLRAVWAVGAGVGLGSLIAGFVRVVWQSPQSGHERWDALTRDLSEQLGIARAVRIVESPLPVMPVTWGSLRPTIVLPASARTWSDARLRAVLGHELAHIRRADWPVQIAVEVITAVFWFNPLFWMARRRLRVESDRACDDIVLGLGIRGADYAAELVNVARALRHRDACAVAPAMARRRSLESRVSAALNDAIDRTPIAPVSCAATFAALLSLALAIAGFGLESAGTTSIRQVSDIERNIMMSLGGEDRRLSLVAGDVSFWKNRIAGRVELQARLGVDGSLNAVRVIEPVHRDIAMAAEAIARQWRREPARLRGVPVEVPIRMTIDFR